MLFNINEQYFSYIRGEDALKTIKLVRKKMALWYSVEIATEKENIIDTVGKK